MVIELAVWTRLAMGPIDVNVTCHNAAMAVLEKPLEKPTDTEAMDGDPRRTCSGQ